MLFYVYIWYNICDINIYIWFNIYDINMVIHECIEIFDKNIVCFCLCLLLIINKHVFASICLHIKWIFLSFFITKTLMPIEIFFFFSILRISLILTGIYMSSKSNSFQSNLSIFLILAWWRSVRSKYLTKHYLKDSLSLILWISIKPVLNGLIILLIWYNCFQLKD